MNMRATAATKTAAFWFFFFATISSAKAFTTTPQLSRRTSSTNGKIKSQLGMTPPTTTAEDSFSYPQYSREVDDNTNNFDVNVAAVNDLIRERGLARTQKQFDKSDAILSELMKDHGVLLNDSHKTWKTATKKELKKRPKQLKKTKQNDVRYRNHFVVSRLAGPHTSVLTEAEILDKIAERRLAQQKQDYRTADRIRNELKTDGVYVEDGLKEWRADGIPFRSRSSSQQQQSYKDQPPPQALEQSEYSQDLLDEDYVEVESLLAQRTKSKARSDYGRADDLRDQLFESYNIRIDDRLGQWSVGGDFGDELNSHWAAADKRQALSYSKSPSSTAMSPADDAYIQRKVDERMRAKRTRNYDLSDAIRDQLLAEYDVTIHDKINQWSVGGDFGPEETSWTHAGQVQYVVRNQQQEEQGDDAEFSPQDLQEIQAKVDERTQAKGDRNQRNVKLAKDIELELSTTFGVAIDDQSRQWYKEQPTAAVESSSSSHDVDDNDDVDYGGSNNNEVVSPPSSVVSPPSLVAHGAALEKELSSLTVVQLKEKLRDAGQKVSGKKTELIERLTLLA